MGLRLQTVHTGTKQESREHLLPLFCLGARRNNLPLTAPSQHLAVAQEERLEHFASGKNTNDAFISFKEEKVSSL